MGPPNRLLWSWKRLAHSAESLSGSRRAAYRASGIVFAPSLAYMDHAWLDAQAQGFSAQPIVELMIPSVVDDSLAPKGAHVASLFCQQFKPEADWEALKERAVQAVFDVVQSHCPNFRASLLGYLALTPLDLEREFGLVGGDIFQYLIRTVAALQSASPWNTASMRCSCSIATARSLPVRPSSRPCR